MREAIHTGKAGKKPISRGIMTEQLVFVSGQGSLDPATGAVVGDDIEAQTIQTMNNVRTVLQAAGLDFDDIVKVNVYLRERKLYDAFNEVYQRFFQPPYPARTAIYCDLNYDLLVEIDVIAIRRDGN